MGLRTAETGYPPEADQHGNLTARGAVEKAVPIAARAAFKFPQRNAPLAMEDLPKKTDKKYKAIAFVENGAWIAMCPVPGCFNAQLVSREDPRWLCAECRGGYFAVVFPKDAAKIEKRLESEPVLRMRRWNP
jgi:hypothetical protein